uniref:Suppressor of forked domain-containing protein n=1 Tax=Aureoumbra lagunensis TaxID=44058 RepID=A0A7S3NLE9_9STRA|mmetsp:Transcript_17041/g.25692  ORF Transcript_17041/g.25692 Transcript_17041/m.25692 type:complete len:722 (+) Transcript_17041:33-2198(+)
MTSRLGRVQNRAPAPIQITAEQLLREAHDRAGVSVSKGTNRERSQITDPEELHEYRTNRRKNFEEGIRHNRMHLGNYIKYAEWEAGQGEFERARSIWERALGVDHRAVTLWLKYAQMEMKNKFVNHARNVWDRAVTLLPRIDQLWYKYTYFEEMLEQYNTARKVFERWMQWEPDEAAWTAYLKFEERRGDVSKMRQVLERMIACHPTPHAYTKYAKWEEKKRGAPVQARAIYERAIAELGDWEMAPAERAKLYINFAAFEARQKEFDRVRAIYEFGTSVLPLIVTDDLDEDGKAIAELHEAAASFEKQHGQVDAIEKLIIERRREVYTNRLKEAPNDYDTWFDLIRLEEEALNLQTKFIADREKEQDHFARIREAYERAVAQTPPSNTNKLWWRRYIYLWINYAVFEEMTAKDTERAQQIYRACLDLIPHQNFTFAKLWLLTAQLELRLGNLDAVRQIMGQALGTCGHLQKPKLYLGYAHIERQLGELDRCRKILAKFVQDAPASCQAWINFAQLEIELGENARARAIFDLAVSQPLLDTPETLWKAYIDFELRIEQDPEDKDFDDVKNHDSRVASLYERLLEKSKHVKVWISFAKYQLDSSGIESARQVLERAYSFLRQDGTKEERVLLLEAWAEIEASQPDNSQLAAVQAKMPRKIKKRRPRLDDDSQFEEYYDYVFPDDQVAPLNLKLLEAARKWKAAQQNDDEISSPLKKKKTVEAV